MPTAVLLYWLLSSSFSFLGISKYQFKLLLWIMHWCLEKEMATHSSILGQSHGQRSLVGYSPWSHKELDMTERLTYIYIYVMLFSKVFKFFFYWNIVDLVSQMVKSLPAMQETQIWSLGQKDPLEKRTATHSRIIAWEIPWTKESDDLQSMGLQRVRHDWMTNTFILLSQLNCSVMLNTTV